MLETIDCMKKIKSPELGTETAFGYTGTEDGVLSYFVEGVSNGVWLMMGSARNPTHPSFIYLLTNLPGFRPC